MTGDLEEGKPKTEMFPDVSSLKDVTVILVEVLNVSAANLIKLDVAILGCTEGEYFVHGKSSSCSEYLERLKCSE